MFKFKDGIKRRNLKRRLKDVDNSSTEVKENSTTVNTTSIDEIEKFSQLPTKNYRNIAPKQLEQAINPIEIDLPTMVSPSAFKLEILADGDDTAHTPTLSEKLLASIPTNEESVEPGFPNSIYIESTSYKMSEEARKMILENVLWSNQRILPNPSKKANRNK